MFPLWDRIHDTFPSFVSSTPSVLKLAAAFGSSDVASAGLAFDIVIGVVSGDSRSVIGTGIQMDQVLCF